MLKKQYLLWLLFSLFVSLVWTALLLVGGLAVRFFGIAVRAFNKGMFESGEASLMSIYHYVLYSFDFDRRYILIFLVLFVFLCFVPFLDNFNRWLREKF